MTEDRNSVIILFLFLSANHIHMTWHWVKSLIHFFCTSFWSPFLFLGVFWLRVIFHSLAPGHWHLWESSPQIYWGSGLWRQIITPQLSGTSLSLRCERNALERGTVSNKNHVLRWCFRWAWWDFYTWVYKSSYFLKKEIYAFIGLKEW